MGKKVNDVNICIIIIPSIILTFSKEKISGEMIKQTVDIIFCLPGAAVALFLV